MIRHAAGALASASFLLLLWSAAAFGQEETGDRDTSSALDEALQELDTETPGPASVPDGGGGDLLSGNLGPIDLRLLDISLDVLAAGGASSERDEDLRLLEGGDHDPRKRGFTLQNVELSFLGAVDPYFNLESHIVYFIDPADNESQLELEEAFLTTNQLPLDLQDDGLQLEAGFFFTEFGRINPVHPHAWDWIDQPVINTRLFGPDGMRGAGFRLGWLTPLPWFSELHAGVQNANGETMSSFLASDGFFDERPVGGRPFTDRSVRSLADLVYLLRWDNGQDLSDELSGKIGLSALFGPNATGSGGRTSIYGGDAVLKWRPLSNDHGWPFLVWQSEIMLREYRADDFDDGTVSFSSSTLEDWGLYTQVLWGFRRNWSAGVRYGFAGGSGASTGPFSGRDADPMRNDRHRVSPLLVWQPTHFSRLRLQYNYDVADHLTAGRAHSVWLGVEVLIGRHPAHSF